MFCLGELHGVRRFESMSSHIIHANKTPVRGCFLPRLREKEGIVAKQLRKYTVSKDDFIATPKSFVTRKLLEGILIASPFASRNLFDVCAYR
jgi:hypothetical protein